MNGPEGKSPAAWPLPIRAEVALGLALAGFLLARIGAGFALRGLYADGAYYAATLWARQGFAILEPSRFTAEALMQAPVVLAMRLGASAPLVAATSLSLAANLLPLLLAAGPWLLLRHQTRRWGLLPLLLFLCFGAEAGIASIADAPTATAYAWALLLLLLLTPSGAAGLLALLLLLVFGSLWLHEAMGLLGPLLALAAFGRARAAETRPARVVFLLAGALLLLAALLAWHAILHPRMPANRDGFMSDVLGLRWLWAKGRPDAMALIGLLGLAALPLAWARPGAWRAGFVALAAIDIALVLFAFLQPMTGASSFAARGNMALASLLAMAALLFAPRLAIPPPDGGRLTWLTALLCLAMALADTAATWQWHRYTATMQLILTEHRGVISWREAWQSQPPAARAALDGFSWPWTTPLMSLWLAPGGQVSCLIANPPGSGWQPFDPARLAGLRAQAEALRAAVITGQ